jgi:hypothetical protein
MIYSFFKNVRILRVIVFYIYAYLFKILKYAHKKIAYFTRVNCFLNILHTPI